MELLISNSSLNVHVKTIRKCYFISKMTCNDEATKFDNYNRMVFVEFLEFVCRIAMEIQDTKTYY